MNTEQRFNNHRDRFAKRREEAIDAKVINNFTVAVDEIFLTLEEDEAIDAINKVAEKFILEWDAENG